MNLENISDFKLEQYVLGELGFAEKQKIEQLAKENEILRARINNIKKSNEDFLVDHSAEDVFEKAKAAEKLATKAKYWSVAKTPLVKIAASIVVLLGIVQVAMFGMNTAYMDNASDGIRLKGFESRFEIWKKNATANTNESDVAKETAEMLKDGAEVTAGDELQLRYVLTEKCFALLFSMDGNGVLTVHVGDNNKAVELESSKMTHLPFAYKLDNAPYFEKFFLVTSSEPFEISRDNVDDVLKGKNHKGFSMTLVKKSK